MVFRVHSDIVLHKNLNETTWDRNCHRKADNANKVHECQAPALFVYSVASKYGAFPMT